MGMAKGEKTKRHVLIALLWMSAVLNLLLLALLTREQPADRSGVHTARKEAPRRRPIS